MRALGQPAHPWKLLIDGWDPRPQVYREGLRDRIDEQLRVDLMDTIRDALGRVRFRNVLEGVLYRARL